MKFKHGVAYDGLSPEMWVACGFAWAAYDRFAPGQECVITSALDGQHSPNSLHYKGLAIDLRTRTLTADEKRDIFTFLWTRLGPRGWDVVQEDTHIHCEWQPKEGEKFAHWTS